MVFAHRFFSGGLLVCLLGLLFSPAALALDKKTSSAVSHYIMAIVCDGLGDVDAAIQEYRKAINTEREVSAIRLNLASSYIKKKDFLKAIAELKAVVRQDPQAPQPRVLLSLLYAAQNLPDLAVIEYTRALENAAKLTPQNTEIYKDLGITYLQQKNFIEAESTFKLLLSLSGQDAEAHFYLASSYYELKNNPAAEMELKSAIELKPDYHQALNFLGYLYVEEGRSLSQAEILIRKALEFEPENGAYLDSLGWFYFQSGQYPEASKYLEKASKLLEDPIIYDHLGDVYQKSGDAQKALQNWEKSLQLEPDQQKVKEKLKKSSAGKR
ncbi:MAG: tetratricopeptide repeat protein [Candidatus Omnitrophota bacterium]